MKLISFPIQSPDWLKSKSVCHPELSIQRGESKLTSALRQVCASLQSFVCVCVYVCVRVRVCQGRKRNQTKSVKSSTVDTSLFLCPETSGLAAEALC